MFLFLMLMIDTFISFTKWFTDFKNLSRSLISFLHSKCADCSMAWTPESVLPDPINNIFSFKSLDNFFWINFWIDYPLAWICQPIKLVPTYSIKIWYLCIIQFWTFFNLWSKHKFTNVLRSFPLSLNF